jgi:hypothetical protein
VTTRPIAKRWQTLTTDEMMMRLVTGWLREPKSKPVTDSGYFWSHVLEAFWSQLSNDNCTVVITAADEVRGLRNSPAWRFTFLTDAASLASAAVGRPINDKDFPRWVEDRIRTGRPIKREDFLCWVEDRIRTPPMPWSLTDKDLRRWLTVTEAKQKCTRKQAFKAASKQLEKTLARGKPRSMEESYNKVQRMRHKAR